MRILEEDEQLWIEGHCREFLELAHSRIYAEMFDRFLDAEEIRSHHFLSHLHFGGLPVRAIRRGQCDFRRDGRVGVDEVRYRFGVIAEGFPYAVRGGVIIAG